MGEGLRVDPALGLLLDAVVADGLGGGDALLEVAVLEDPSLVDRAAPEPGEAVRLQLQAELLQSSLASSGFDWLWSRTFCSIPSCRWM